jgi:acetate kinase
MNVLVINGGSSSIKFSVFTADGKTPQSLLEGELTGVGGAGTRLKMKDGEGKDLAGGAPDGAVQADTPEQAIQVVMDAVFGEQLPAIDAVGYRVVHPGAKLKGHCRITDEVLQELEKAAEFAPLHDPAALEVIRAVMGRTPKVPHFACFDTVFHESMGAAATTYPLPAVVRERGVRRYGFHGLSCESIVLQLRQAATEFPRRMAIAHLGSGCSVTAVVDGRSIDTTMGMTPTGGVVMGTRPGDLDPGVMLYLLRQEGATAESVEKMVNHAAGMVALSGMANDMKAVREAAAKGDEQALLAVEVFSRSIRKAIGGFAWLMGGLDAVVFAGGIGEHDAASRTEILTGLEEMGVALEERGSNGGGVRLASRTESRVAIYIVPAEEDRMIAVHVRQMMGRGE